MSSAETEIEALQRRFAEAWNREDGAATVEDFAEDALRNDSRGNIQRGRAAIRDVYVALVGTNTIHLEPGGTRLLSDAVAIWQSPMELRARAGGAVTRGWVLDVLVKRDGRWWILEAHVKLFPTGG